MNVIESDLQGSALIARVVCRDINLANLDQLNKKLNELLDTKPQKYIIDIKKMNYLDSSAIGIILNIMKRVKEYKGSFYLVGVNPTIATVLNMSKVNNVLNVREDVQAALAES